MRWVIKTKAVFVFIWIWMRYMMWTKKQKEKYPQFSFLRVYVGIMNPILLSLKKEFDEQILILRFPSLKKKIDTKLVVHHNDIVSLFGTHDGEVGELPYNLVVPTAVQEIAEHPLSYQERLDLEKVPFEEREEARRNFLVYKEKNNDILTKTKNSDIVEDEDIKMLGRKK